MSHFSVHHFQNTGWLGTWSFRLLKLELWLLVAIASG
jgi:hypothetical protein